MNRKHYTIVFIVGILAGIGGFMLRPKVLASAQKVEEPTTAPSEDEKPVNTVKTAPLHKGEITQILTAYGNVTAEPGAVAVYSVPIEARIVHLLVNGGQPVDKGAPLLQIEPSPDSKLQLLDDRNAMEAAKRNLADTQQRFDMKLATNTELLQSQQALQAAQLKLDDLMKRGAAEGIRTITANDTALVSKLDVQEGQIVPAGSPLVDLLPRGQIEVRLGVEPTNVSFLKIDQSVKLFPSTASADGITGKVRLIAQRVNPDTRLIDVFVAPDSKNALLLESFVRGELSLRSEQGLIAPRQAVLPDDEGFTLFTVKDGHAVKHTVTVGLQNDREIAVVGEGLQDGDLAVVQGNLELEDGMAVSTEDQK